MVSTDIQNGMACAQLVLNTEGDAVRVIEKLAVCRERCMVLVIGEVVPVNIVTKADIAADKVEDFGDGLLKAGMGLAEFLGDKIEDEFGNCRGCS